MVMGVLIQEMKYNPKPDSTGQTASQLVWEPINPPPKPQMLTPLMLGKNIILLRSKFNIHLNSGLFLLSPEASLKNSCFLYIFVLEKGFTPKRCQ